ncbi:hypothetical protein Tco_0357067 [Tanacetum coccineum]
MSNLFMLCVAICLARSVLSYGTSNYVQLAAEEGAFASSSSRNAETTFPDLDGLIYVLCPLLVEIRKTVAFRFSTGVGPFGRKIVKPTERSRSSLPLYFLQDLAFTVFGSRIDGSMTWIRISLGTDTQAFCGLAEVANGIVRRLLLRSVLLKQIVAAGCSEASLSSWRHCPRSEYA